MKLKGFKVAILACDGFEEKEMTVPQKALEKEGAIVHLISPQAGKIKSWYQNKWHKTFPTHARLEKAKPETYSLLLLPGGVLNPDKLRTCKLAIEFIDHFFKKNKPIAAICHAPVTLIETKRLRYRKITSYPSIKTDLVNAGARWQNKPVVVDKNLITSRTPKDLPWFVKTIIKTSIKEKMSRNNRQYKKEKMKEIARKPFIE